jgi:hypothetical protein
MLRQVFRQFVHDLGNGRAVENARRDVHRDRFVHERIEAIVQRLAEPAPSSLPRVARGGRGAA